MPGGIQLLSLSAAAASSVRAASSSRIAAWPSLLASSIFQALICERVQHLSPRGISPSGPVAANRSFSGASGSALWASTASIRVRDRPRRAACCSITIRRSGRRASPIHHSHMLDSQGSGPCAIGRQKNGQRKSRCRKCLWHFRRPDLTDGGARLVRSQSVHERSVQQAIWRRSQSPLVTGGISMASWGPLLPCLRSSLDVQDTPSVPR